MSGARTGWVIGVSATVLFGCQMLTSLDEAEVRVASPDAGEDVRTEDVLSDDVATQDGPDDATSDDVIDAGDALVPDADVTDSAEGCDATNGAVMVRVSGGFCVDSTEVTQAQYEVWAATASVAQQDPDCVDWNTTFTPSCDWNPTNRPNHPVVCVDWCDAKAYCTAMGKRLCAGFDGENYGEVGLTDPSTSEWFNACSSNGVNAYVYGANYDGSKCNTWENQETGCDTGATCSTRPVAELTECQSSVDGYTGVFDLSGNVAEWENACETWNSDHRATQCYARGGAVQSSGSIAACAFTQDHHVRDTRSPLIGIRCCK